MSPAARNRIVVPALLGTLHTRLRFRVERVGFLSVRLTFDGGNGPVVATMRTGDWVDMGIDFDMDPRG